jgi:dTDP-4-amino-4,6-dideoxygalactose transaminase
MSIGANRDGRKVGAFGDLAACSFYATKMMTSGGEGGMLLMDVPELADRARELREYDGMAADRTRYNFKMTEAAAAVGRVQLRRLDEFAARRRHLAAGYDEAFRRLPVTLPTTDPGAVYHRYVLGLQRPVEGLIDRFEAFGVAVRKPVPRPLHRELSGCPVPCPVTDRACELDLSIPLFPSLTEPEVEQVTRAVSSILRENG